jgi:hypothetical protein
MPTVRLVSPAASTDAHAGTDAFEHELQTVLRWPLDPTFSYTPYWVGVGANSYATLGAAANAAVTDLPALGGSRFDQPNITGFFIDSLATCIEQLAAITDPTACILYDNTNTPSVPIYNYLVANPAGKALVWLAWPFAPAAIVDNSTFMMIPNARFYNARAAIVPVVHGRITGGLNVHAVYPEREYKHGHAYAVWGRVRVHGHHVQLTYRQAAHLADKILRGRASVAAGTLPAMQEAEKDQ